MFAVQVAAALGVAVLVGSVLAARLRLSAPVVLVVIGLLLTIVPSLRRVELPPEVVLLIFLPILLFWESFSASAREIRRQLGRIVLSGTLLVVVTAAVVAVVGHALGLSWATAWLIGAAVAPTDATAVAALGRLMPRRETTMLQAESLINDGTALVVFGLALEFATEDIAFSSAHAGRLLAVSLTGALVVGAAIGWIDGHVRRFLSNPRHHNVLAVLTPFAAFLVAEEIHASGVLAVVVSGLWVSQTAPRTVSAQARQQGTGFWTLTTFLLNGGLFVLIGMEIPIAVDGLAGGDLRSAVAAAVGVYVAVLVTRFAFISAMSLLGRLFDRNQERREMRSTLRGRVVVTVAGLRGAVSLAVALSVPATIAGGAARDTAVFVTACVVVGSLTIQGLLLPHVVRWAELPEESTTQDELDFAIVTALDAAIFALNQGPDFEERIAAPFRRRRELIAPALAGSNRVTIVPSGGGMFVMLDIRATGLSGEAFALRLLDEEGIAVMPGESFGTAAAGHVRVAMTIPDAEFSEALGRLGAFADRI